MKNQSASLKKVALVTLLGGAVEWYCFLLYGQAAGTVFNKVFFSGVSDPYSAQILSYISFAIGYLARPFGAEEFLWRLKMPIPGSVPFMPRFP